MKGKNRRCFFLIAGLLLLLVASLVGCANPQSLPPTIAFSPPSFSLNVQQGETTLLADTLHISNSGSGTLDWLVSDDADWISLSPTSGSSIGEIDEVTVSMDIGGLSVGNHAYAITIFAPGASNTPQTVLVKLTITENPRHIYENGAIEVGGDGEPIDLINNPNAINPTYAELVDFIKEDPTDEHRYISSFEVSIGAGKVSYICSDFAEDVHNNAEEAGIRAAWVSIYFEGDDEGHALNAFETIDRGLVYIDCTGGDLLSRLPGRLVKTEEGFSFQKYSPTNWDKVAYVEIGKEYGLLDITTAESLSYSFYEEYKQKWQEYEELVAEYNEAPDWMKQTGLVRLHSEEEEEAWKRIHVIRSMIDELNEELGNYWFEPLGIVKDIHIHWGRE